MFVVTAGCGAKTVGSGKAATETRTVNGFSGVELAATGTLEITPGNEDALVVEAEDNHPAADRNHRESRTARC